MGKYFYLIFLGAFFSSAFSWADTSAFQTHRIQRVIDGDTVVLENGEHVRLIGINTPEYEPWKNFEQPCGKEASQFAKKEFTQKNVRLERDVELQDKYRRTLAYLYLEDGRMINEIMVQKGYARARYYKPNGKHRQRLEAAARLAKINRVGCVE